ncbi:MAG: hypothetical protein ABR582_14160, partial [Gemmatimonadaceae bacterium]
MQQFRMPGNFFVVTSITIAFFIAQPVIAHAQETAKVGPSLPDSIKVKVDRIFAEWNKFDSPGCAFGVVKNGKMIYERGYGMANLDYDIAISPASVFEIGSM